MTKYSSQNTAPQINAEFLHSLGAIIGDAALVSIKDKSFGYIYANASYEALFRTTSGALIGTTIKDWVNKGQAAEIELRDAQVLDTDKATKFIERFDFDGRKISCATIRFPYKDIKGNTIGVASVAIALSDENQNSSKELNSELSNAKKEISDLRKTISKLKEQVTIDQLTGVGNRAYINTNARRGIEMFNRYGHPFSVIFADIDNFKSINDELGHAIGDDVIKTFCSVVQASLRATDIFGRWGGEEFVVLLPNTGRMSASIIAERVRSAVSEHRIQNIGHVTASFGVAVSAIGDTFESLIDRADKTMYRAKNSGRNRVEIEPDFYLENYAEVVTQNFVGLIWSSAYECGHPLIDSQHRVLFEQSNELLNAVLAVQPKEEISKQISTLLTEIVKHFESEEAVLKDTEFPATQEHHDIHKKLVEQALSLAKKYNDDEMEIGELFSFLAHDVISKHMLTEDREFFPYLM